MDEEKNKTIEGGKKITPEPIMKMIWGMWSFRTIHAAVDLEIFTKIEGGVDTSEKIASELKISNGAVERLLNACVSLELLENDENKYVNTSVASEFLVKGKPKYYGDMVIMFGTKDALKDLKEAVLTDSPVIKDLTERMEDTEQAKIFTKAMHSNAMGPAMVLSKKFDFSKYKKLLDLGGGSGAFSIVLSRQYSNLTATVFDLPKVCSVAKGFIKVADMESRVGILDGDFFKDELPEGYDIILISQILHSWSVEENKILLRKVYDSLPNEGVVIINEFLLNEDKTGPLFPALFALNMLVQSDGGNAYTENEIRSWLEEVGFEYLESIKLGGPVTAIVAKKSK